jgi:hypothetical protein
MLSTVPGDSALAPRIGQLVDRRAPPSRPARAARPAACRPCGRCRAAAFRPRPPARPARAGRRRSLPPASSSRGRPPHRRPGVDVEAVVDGDVQPGRLGLALRRVAQLRPGASPNNRRSQPRGVGDPIRLGGLDEREPAASPLRPQRRPDPRSGEPRCKPPIRIPKAARSPDAARGAPDAPALVTREGVLDYAGLERRSARWRRR